MTPGSRLPEGRVDVVVVGGTVAGRLVARGLARGGARVLLLGPDGPRDLGLAALGLAEQPARTHLALGDERSAALFGWVRNAARALDAPLEDLVWLATGPGELPWVDESVATLRRLGFPAEALDRDGLAARGLAGERGFVVPAGLALVDPDRAFARWADSPGVHAALDLAPDRIDEDADGLVVHVGGRAVRAEVVVLADGRSASRLAPWLADKTTPVREQRAVFRGELRAAGRAGHGWTSFRPWPIGVSLPEPAPRSGFGEEAASLSGNPEDRRSGRSGPPRSAPADSRPFPEASPLRSGFAVAGCRWATPHLEVGETDAAPQPAVQARLAAFAAGNVVPGADGAASAAAWIEDHPCDGLPIVGPLPGAVRWVACVGHGGAAWSLGPPTAEMVVDGLLGGPTRTPDWLAAHRFL